MMRKELIIVLLLVGVIVAASGCATKTSTTNTTTIPAPVQVNNTTIINNPAPVNNPNPHTYTVNIENNAFNPSFVQIPDGSTVKWINLDSIPHEPKGNVFDSGPLNQNGVFEYTFNQAGTYNYACAIHPSMQGTVKVV